MSSYDIHNKVSRKFKVLDGFPTTLIAFVKHTLYSYYPYNMFESAIENCEYNSYKLSADRNNIKKPLKIHCCFCLLQIALPSVSTKLFELLL